MRRFRTWAGGAALAGGLAVAAACGSSSSTTPSGPSGGGGGGCTPSTSANTLVIQNNTICPATLTVARGTQITVVNSDSRVHEMDSDPHPEHTDCTELNQIGHLEPSQSRQSGNLNIARKCGMHDHISPDTTSLRATITIQ
jgi:plastocyanin